MRGYYVPAGFMGLVGNRYRLFATETDYYDFMKA